MADEVRRTRRTPRPDAGNGLSIADYMRGSHTSLADDRRMTPVNGVCVLIKRPPVLTRPESDVARWSSRPVASGNRGTSWPNVSRSGCWSCAIALSTCSGCSRVRTLRNGPALRRMSHTLLSIGQERSVQRKSACGTSAGSLASCLKGAATAAAPRHSASIRYGTSELS